MSNTTFPTAIDSPAYDPQTTDTLASASHHVLHGFANDAILAIEQKLGSGPSNNSPTTNSLLQGTGTDTSEWLTTLTSFSITTSLLDSNNNTWIGQTPVTSAVDYINIANSAAGGTPYISVKGTDNNINLNLVPKGSGKVQDNGSNLIDFRSSFANYVQTGAVWSLGSGLAASMSAGTVWINGIEYAIGVVSSHTFGASTDTYVDYTVGSGLVYTAVSNNAASPALAANSVRLVIVVSGSSSISSLNQGQTSAVTPITSSVAYSVTDSIGNLIFPTNPIPKMIGFKQYTGGTVTGSGATPTQITGLSAGVIVGSNSPTIKISVYAASLNIQTSTAIGYVSIYAGATQGALTTQVGGIAPNIPSGYSMPVIAVTVLRSPSAGLVYYSAALSATSSNAQIGTSTTTPAILTVEQD